MSMEEIVKELKELKEDRKYDREMILFLKERLLKAESQGKDEHLHKKIDQLVTNMESQRQLDQKVDRLSEELGKCQGYIAYFMESHDNLKKQLVNLGESRDLANVLDTVQTTEGYVELFVKDFDKINGALQLLEAGVAGNSQQLSQFYQEKVDNTVPVSNLNKFGDKLEDINAKLKQSDEFQENLDGKLKQISCLLTTVNEKMENIDLNLQSQNLEFENFKKETKKMLTANASSDEEFIDEFLPDTVLKCRGCKQELPEVLEFIEDGVTAECPNCDGLNIVGRLKPGFKWMTGTWCNHAQQYILCVRAGERDKCQVCGRTEQLKDANYQMALRS